MTTFPRGAVAAAFIASLLALEPAQARPAPPLPTGPGDVTIGERDGHPPFIMHLMGPEGADQDKDGAVSAAEWRAFHDRMFADMDRNHDGRLSPDELGPPPGAEHDVKIFHMRHGPEAPGGPGAPPPPPPPASLDTNNDGKVSFEEFAAPLREAFDDMDADHDGVLDEGEAPKGRRIEIRKEVRVDTQK